jgi:hypothetical protein
MRPADGVFARLFDDELLIIDLSRGEYFALDPIGARLWSAIEDGQSVERLAHALTAEYHVAFEQALADLEALVAELVARGLLVAVAGGKADVR